VAGSDAMKTMADVYDALSAPDDRSGGEPSRLDGDLVLLGVGGKLGPELALMARRALDLAGKGSRVIGVARNLDEETATRLTDGGVELARPILMLGDQLAGFAVGSQRYPTWPAASSGPVVANTRPGHELLSTWLVAERFRDIADRCL